MFKKEKLLSKQQAEKYYGCDKTTIYSNKENFVNFPMKLKKNFIIMILKEIIGMFVLEDINF